MKSKYLNIIILAIMLSINFMSQTLKYAEDGVLGHPYPYKDYPPEAHTIRNFSLIHEYLLKDNPKNMMPASNIIDLRESYIAGNQFHLSIMEGGWNFQSMDPTKFKEIEPEDIRYSIVEAFYLDIFKDLGINLSTIEIEGNTGVILNTNKELGESDSLDICNALRRVIIVPYGSGEDLSAYKDAPVGAGPFYEDLRKNYELHLSSENTMYYFHDEPRLDEIIIKRIAKSLQGDYLESGDIDLMIDANVFNEIKYCDLEYRCKSVASDFAHLLFINHRSSLMDTPEFREALAYSIDKAAMAELYHGSILNGPLSSRNIFSNNNIIPRGYNLDKSRKLIESLGYYFDESQGFFKDPTTSQSLKIKLLYNPKLIDDAVIYLIEKNFKDLGIKLKRVGATPFKIEKMLKSKSDENWDLYYSYEHMQSRTFIRKYYHSSEMNTNNWGGYQHKNIDLLLDKFNKSDGTEKSILGPQIHKALYDDVAVIGLFVNPTWAIYQEYLTPFIVPYYYFNKPYKWSIDK